MSPGVEITPSILYCEMKISETTQEKDSKEGKLQDYCPGIKDRMRADRWQQINREVNPLELELRS